MNEPPDLHPGLAGVSSDGDAGPGKKMVQTKAQIKLLGTRGDGLFSIRRPAHVGSGLSSGLKSMGKGLAGGLVLLVAAPTVGALMHGPRGFGVGVAVGLLTFIFLPVVGTGVCIYQVTRGVLNTPDAIAAGYNALRDRLAGRGGELVTDNAAWTEERDALMRAAWSAAAAAGALPSHLLGGPPEAPALRALSLYEVLGVAKDASAEEIKRAYHKLARALHPDKAGGDPEAHTRFLALSRAWDVLRDPDARARYDEAGDAGLDAPQVDLGAVFVAVFDAERLLPWTGVPAAALASVAAMVGAPGAVSPAEQRRMQEMREASLATHLASVLRRGYEATSPGGRSTLKRDFASWAHTVAATLASGPAGEKFCAAMGSAYGAAASRALGMDLAGVPELILPESHPDGDDDAPVGCLSGVSPLAGLTWGAQVALGFVEAQSAAVARVGRTVAARVAYNVALAGLALRMLTEAQKLQAAAEADAAAAATAAASASAAAADAASPPMREDVGAPGYVIVDRPPGEGGGRAAPPAGAEDSGGPSRATHANRVSHESRESHDAKWERPDPGAAFFAQSFGMGGPAGTAHSHSHVHVPVPPPPSPQAPAAAAAESAASAPPLAPPPSAQSQEKAQEEKVKAAMEGALPQMLSAAWGFVALDLDTTLDRVAARVLTDPAVSKRERRSRGVALRTLAGVLVAAKGTPGLPDGAGVMRRLAEAAARGFKPADNDGGHE